MIDFEKHHEILKDLGKSTYCVCYGDTVAKTTTDYQLALDLCANLRGQGLDAFVELRNA